MMEKEEIYDSQISSVVRGFMLVWNRFEGTLSKELARIQGSLVGMHPSRVSQPNANYELFYRACSSIYPEGNITMGEFSSALSVPLSTATRIADWLVENGYIHRLPDSDDRRVVRVALSEQGRVLYKTIDIYIRRRLQQILDGLTEEERTTLLKLVGRVVSGLREAAG